MYNFYTMGDIIHNQIYIATKYKEGGITMLNRYPPISKKCNHMLHGADYNPEQWKDTPETGMRICD